MSKIINTEKASLLSQEYKQKGKTVVLTGGCFDVLHLGHIRFLEAAKKSGDILFVFVESDENVKKSKGKNRPINNQQDRMYVLSSIRFVDFIIKTPFMKNNLSYDNLITKIAPSIIAVTKKSETVKHAQRQAKQIDCKLIEVIDRVSDRSTSRIAQIIEEENKL
jgi:FAD synthetase